MSDEHLATDPAEFWDRRHDLDLRPTSAADVAARSRSYERHLVLVWNLASETGAAFDSARDRLDAFDCLAVAPTRYLHATVKVLGDVTDAPDWSDAGTHSVDDAPEFADDIAEALDGVDPFDARFTRLNLFPSVVYSEIDAGGRFAALNDHICSSVDVPVSGRDRRFIPHVALADFVDESDYDSLVDRLETDRRIDVGPVEVNQLELVSVDLADRFPRFDTVRRYDLDGATG
jgi:2'-5' RNA ligase